MIAAHESMRRGADARLDWAEANARPKNKVTEARIRTPVLPMARPRRAGGTPSPPPPPPRTRRTSRSVAAPGAASHRTVDVDAGRGVARARPGRTSGPSTRPRCGGWARWGSRRSSRRASPRRGVPARRARRKSERVDASAESVFSVFFHASRILVYEIFVRILPSLPASLSRVRTVVLATFDAGIRLSRSPVAPRAPFRFF